jgi:hypothetical protein
MGGKKKEPKWNSEDPNALRSLVDEIRQEVVANAPSEGKKTKMSNFNNPKLQGGDNYLIDGPDDYAFNKLALKSGQSGDNWQGGSGGNYDEYHQSQFYYPYNAVYDNYQAPQHDYQETYSYHDYMRPNYPQHGGYQSDHSSWYSYDSYHSMGHPYYQGGPPRYQHGHPSINQPMYGGHFAHPSSQKMLNSQQLAAPKYNTIGTLSPFSNSKNSQLGEGSSCDNEDGGNQHQNDHNPSSPGKTKNQLKRFKQLIEAKSSNILHVKGLENDSISAELINSLFSNFGNILKILFVKHKKAAFIVYESQDLGMIAKEMLSNLRFMDCHLKVAPVDQITFSNDVTFDKILAKENQNQLLIPNPKFYRFKDKKISINPPSKTLHLSNIAREIYTEAEMTNIFNEHAPVKKVK